MAPTEGRLLGLNGSGAATAVPPDDLHDPSSSISDFRRLLKTAMLTRYYCIQRDWDATWNYAE